MERLHPIANSTKDQQDRLCCEAADYATHVSIELEKVRYMLVDVISDYLSPLRYALEHGDKMEVDRLILFKATRVEVKARIAEDILAGLDTETATFIERFGH